VSPGSADAGAVAECLGGRAVGDAPIWDAGLPQVMLEVADLDGLSPDHDALRLQARDEGWAGVSAYVVRGRGNGAVEAEVRHFASPIGIPEDPVTGSAAGALGAALAAGGDGDAQGGLRLVVRQGRHLGRDGLVQVDVAGGPGGPTAVTIGGAVVPVMAGIISEGIIPG
jgi:PhzF family phenazine biosynthesis protein